MIREDLYYRLLNYSKKMCINLYNVNYIEVAHDIICEGGVNEQNFTNIFLKKKREILNTKRDLSFIEGSHFSKSMTYYKYCPDCDDVLPDHEFYRSVGPYRNKYCKAHENKREYLKDTVRPARDRTDWSRNQAQKERDEIRDKYVIDVLKKNGFNKEDITAEMIVEKKRLLYLKRAKKCQYSNPQFNEYFEAVKNLD